ncbi:hypothetical protein IEO21_06681 [Rhodonia placenta]|uniref:Hypervirulence associated protein TUDOR domain-containing protein n=2 Tax=Rhodonia placenta TaxID=104341 RepID=A0A8H7NZR9_9APHY|nr:hypothetical protein IEO21_06681 [Postia placenta]
MVGTRFRGGKREGKVEAVVQNDQEAQNADLGTTVKNPPKVEVDAFSHGHKVAHNPGTLSHGEDSG